MKKNELRLIIRSIVREEVQMALKKELTEVFKSLKSKPITETKRVRKVVKKKRKMEKLAKDPVLNKILNETRGGIPVKEGYEEYPTMKNKTFDRTSMASLMGYGDTGSEEGGSNIAQTTQGHSGAIVKDESLAKALNKDYSGLMKAIDKKKKSGNGPLIP